MKSTFIFVTLISSLFCCEVDAGFKSLTAHSRANCLNNESISWDARAYWHLWTSSTHNYVDNGLIVSAHFVGTGDWQFTWRSAAVHWWEGKGENMSTGRGWWVEGEHFVSDKGGTFGLGSHVWTSAIDCRWYDGWWDK